jgi:hypothetical protein
MQKNRRKSTCGGDNLIQAVLEGTEDILTSTVFGTLKYLRPDMILIVTVSCVKFIIINTGRLQKEI